MKNRIKLLLSVFACLSLTPFLGAQIYSRGDDPASVKWSSIRTDEFRLIYPSGLDSLARVYGSALEAWRRAVGRSIGVEPNQMYRRPTPVILHSHLASANGMVAWAPRRMELDISPDALRPDALDWVTNLAIHESRHLAQMQLGRDRLDYKIIGWLSGNALPGIMSGIYPGQHLLEGDAVVAETALTDMGRGRSADFLEYYMASFDEGRMRDWYKWRYGSVKYFTPDHYKLGYLTVAGIRYVYDAPEFAKSYFSNISSGKLPFRFFVMNRTLKEISGMKLRDTWKAITAAQDSIWQENIAARGPYSEAEKLTPTPKRFTQYTGSAVLGDGLYSISDGITSGKRLVRLDRDGGRSSSGSSGGTFAQDRDGGRGSGRSFSRPFAWTASGLTASEATGRLYWSEVVPDLRWGLRETSRIRYMEPGSRRFRTLTRNGRLYNPAPSPDGNTLAVTAYPSAGGSSVEVLDAADGQVISHHPAPDSLQVVESAWVDGKILASAIAPSGFGIYDVSEGYSPVLAAQPVKISRLRAGEDGLLFVSDRLGVNELYCLDSNGTVRRLTNNRLGASDFVVTGDSLYFSALSSGERAIYKEKISPVGEIDFSSRYHHPIADKLSEQEARTAAADTRTDEPTSFSEPRRYRKLPHLFRFHTWMPVYADSDAISELSFDKLVSNLSPGFLALFQNSLGTASGSVGYSIMPEKLVPAEQRERNGFHAKFTYSGLFPVFEFDLDVTDGEVHRYDVSSLILSPTRASATMYSRRTGLSPHISGSVRVYVPLNLSSGGWNRGVVPQVSIIFSNDYIQTSIIKRSYVPATGMRGSGLSFFDGADIGRTLPFTRMTAGIRGYAMTATPAGCAFPRWGVGAETGVSLRPGFSDILSTNAFGYLYGYVPGVLPGHGVRITALVQSQTESIFKEMYTRVLPRGFEATSEINRYVLARYPVSAKFGLDYAMPLLNLDWSGLGPLAYVKNIDMRPHFEYSVFGGTDKFEAGSLFSVGTELCVNLGNLAMIPYSTRIGVTYSHNGGKSWAGLQDSGVELSRDYFGLVFSIAI